PSRSRQHEADLAAIKKPAIIMRSPSGEAHVAGLQPFRQCAEERQAIVRLDGSPPARRGEVEPAIVPPDPMGLAEMLDLLLPGADMLDHVIRDRAVEGIRLEGQGRSLHETKLESAGLLALILDIDRADLSRRPDLPAEIRGDETGTGSHLDDGR